jgi:hypothetical protein
MRPLLVPALLALAACGGDARFAIRDQSCSADVVPLARDLTTHLVNGEGDGTFDYDPDSSVIAQVTGSYDLVTGDFSWTETGTDESWVDSIEMRDAWGYANTNGDLDVVGTLVVMDVLGVEDVRQVRIERVGCQQTRRVRFTSGGTIERESVEEGTFSDDAYIYTIETDYDGTTYEVDGTRQVDGTWVEGHTYLAENYRYRDERVGDLNAGTSTSVYSEVFSVRGGETRREGTVERATDGSETRRFTQISPDGTSEWEYTTDYGGNGSGTVSGPGYTCTLQFVDDRCTFDCGNGQRGNC